MLEEAVKAQKDIALALMGIGKELEGIREIVYDLKSLAVSANPPENELPDD